MRGLAECRAVKDRRASGGRRGGKEQARGAEIGTGGLASDRGWKRFQAEVAYTESAFRFAIGDLEASIRNAERCLEILPDYAPALLTVGSIEYQRRRPKVGRRHFEKLLALPEETEDLAEILDEAGTFLIRRKRYAEGLDLFREAAARFPKFAGLHAGVSCCAGHLRKFEEAVAASRRAVSLSPGDAGCVSDLGWSLAQAGRLEEARKSLRKAVAMNPEDELARRNLEFVEKRLARSC
jgi:tetratricopeptide (TPR) repeat protein